MNIPSNHFAQSSSSLCAHMPMCIEKSKIDREQCTHVQLYWLSNKKKVVYSEVDTTVFDKYFFSENAVMKDFITHLQPHYRKSCQSHVQNIPPHYTTGCS